MDIAPTPVWDVARRVQQAGKTTQMLPWVMRPVSMSIQTLRFVAAAIVLAGLALVWGNVFVSQRMSYEDSIRSSETETRLLAATFAEHAEATIRLIDTASIMLAQAWTRDRAGFDATVSNWSTNLAHLALQVAVADRDAVVAYSNLGTPTSAVSLADREHIRVHLDRKHEGIFVSRPLIGRVSRKWSIQFTRVIEREGEIDGVIVISLDPEYFLNFYKSLPLQDAAVVSMVRHTGELMVHAPGNSDLGTIVSGVPFLAATAPLYGNYASAGGSDGVARVNAYHRLPQYGLTLTAGVALAGALEPFHEQRTMRYVAALTVSLTLIAMALVALREVEAGRRRAQRLSAENEGLEARVAERTAELFLSLEKIEKLNIFMERLLHSSPAVLYTLSYPKLDLTFVSSNVAEKLGWSPEDFLGDHDLWNRCVHPEDQERAVIDLERLARTGAHSMRVRFRSKDGKYLWMNHELSLVRDGHGNAVEITGAFWDVSAHVVLEQQLNERQKLEAIGQLTGGLAHDFNNLLGIVVGNLDLIGEGLDPEHPLHKPYQAALDATMRGVEITRLLLAVARRQPLEVARYDLNQLVEQMMPLVRSSVGSAITVRVQFAAGPLIAALDAASLSNVVLNLVINARDAMRDRPGAKILTLRTRAKSIEAGGDPDLKEGRYAVLEVGDTGTGMTPAVRAQAFEPFFTTKERGKGTGLGLSMAHGYATQLGGTIRIESTEGVGTTMRVFLPMLAETAASAEQVVDAEPATPSIVAPLAAKLVAMAEPLAQVAGARPATPASRKRVLVVDDEPGLCTLACDWIRALGYDVDGVQSPQDALARLDKERFDLLFTDVVMPGDMDGLALAAEARSRQPELRVLLASGYARVLLENRSLPGPLLSKPYRKKEVAQAVDAALRS
jgi:PAS domain S-box-containing protein